MGSEHCLGENPVWLWEWPLGNRTSPAGCVGTRFRRSKRCCHELGMTCLMSSLLCDCLARLVHSRSFQHSSLPNLHSVFVLRDFLRGNRHRGIGATDLRGSEASRCLRGSVRGSLGELPGTFERGVWNGAFVTDCSSQRSPGNLLDRQHASIT